MKKTFAAILTILAHMAPFAAGAALTAASVYANKAYDYLAQLYAIIAVSVLFGLLYCGALLLMTAVKLPLAISVAGFFFSFFYMGFCFFGFLYGWILRYEVLIFAGMFIPFWLMLLVRSVYARQQALLESEDR